jgi:hypothetical protein
MKNESGGGFGDKSSVNFYLCKKKWGKTKKNTLMITRSERKDNFMIHQTGNHIFSLTLLAITALALIRKATRP